MSNFLNYFVNGLSGGAIYALIALGFVIVFKATEVVNFAHGSLVVLGGYVVYLTNKSLPFVIAVLCGAAAAGLAALFMERVFVRKLRDGGLNALAILTIGVDIVVITEMTRRLGANGVNIDDPWGSKLVHVGPITLFQSRVAALLTALVLLGAFFAVFKFSSWGVAMRAAAEDGEAAALMGIRRGRVTAIAWFVAGALAAVAAVFLVAQPTPGLDSFVRVQALRAFPAAILGGLDSTAGAVVGGLLIGILDNLAGRYVSGGFRDTIVFAVIVLVLFIRPSGVLGAGRKERV